MTAVIVLAIVAVVLAVVIFAVASRRSGSADGVANFRRQIDALSPEARRPVVDQVQRLEEGFEEEPPPDPEDPQDPARDP